MTTYQCAKYDRDWLSAFRNGKTFDVEFDPETMLLVGSKWLVDNCVNPSDPNAIWRFCYDRKIRMRGFYITETTHRSGNITYKGILAFHAKSDAMLFKLSWP